MHLKSLPAFVKACPYRECPSHLVDELCSRLSGSIVRYGFYHRTSDGRRPSRFLCKICKKTFSSARYFSTFNQKKRHLNSKVNKLLCSGVSLNRIAFLLGINVKTVVRKFLFLADRAEAMHQKSLDGLIKSRSTLSEIQFDEMESSIHSKCLPVSLPLIVVPKTRMIIGVDIAKMPAKGPLSKISLQKYGPRQDERAEVAKQLLRKLKPLFQEQIQIESDEKPQYPNWIKSELPQAIHKAYKGKRGCVVGQGELKKTVYDPLFSFNHTAAMIRANISRLFRRTWNTSKRMDRLLDHLRLYVHFHNTKLI